MMDQSVFENAMRGLDDKAVISTKTSQKVGYKSEGRFQKTNPKFGTNAMLHAGLHIFYFGW